MVQRFRESITHRPPFTSGTIAAQPDELILFFGKGNKSERLDYATAGPEELDALSRACDRASFGLNGENVHDESYRKAGKLDSAFFSTSFVPERNKLASIVGGSLLEGDKATRPLHFELYKLNVYGEGSFFKPHQDTPRGGDMFASLVVVFPAAHEGGALVLRHGGEEWTFDAAQALDKESTPSVAYIAFFSDVEHEVLPVTKGHRVTLTYNIYYADDGNSKVPNPPTFVDPHARSSYGGTLKNRLAELIKCPDFLPEGGNLGFGLRHVYPVVSFPSNPLSASLDNIRLKGTDRLLDQVCTALGLETQLYFLYREDDDRASDAVAASGFHVDLGCNEVIMSEDVPYAQTILGGEYESFSEAMGGTRIYDPENDRPLDDVINWVTVPNSWTRTETALAYYGNEPGLSWVYADVCLVATVPEAGDR
ncbi:hypothetical protein FA95DRAFT_1499456 [Auriscalpium vulgare]|uniref:Uncharacterized protein n=1 Tax=Auriscalpium vulgare TaxID=40419 RepID=A0ACB8RGQ2_9AGAM|nr:hypothetical protein FA95DRAFT_1499456 [Auriscalpium vulgare]